MSECLVDLPVRSADGLAALDVFYSGFNDVNFYVEDAGQENLYEVILCKIFPEYRIFRIFPLGGKRAVLSHANDQVNVISPGAKVYLLDKDFDDILLKMEVHNNVYYLDRYCIENFLMEPEAICEIVIEHNPKLARADVARELNVETVLPGLFKDLRGLFTWFFCAQLFELGLRNCSAKPEEFCCPKKLWQIDVVKIQAYELQLFALMQGKNIAPPLVDPSVDARLSVFREASDHSIVSGKFALAMMFHYAKTKYSFGSITFDSFVYRLAKNSNFDSLQGLAEQIRSYMRARNAVRH